MPMRNNNISIRQRHGGRRVLLTSDFRIKIPFKIESFYGSVTQKLIKGILHNIFSGLLHCVISQLLWFKNQELLFASFVYMHTTISIE